MKDRWYQHRVMWLVVGLPAAVVIASFVTLYLALRHPDPLVNDRVYKDGLRWEERGGGDGTQP